MASAPDIAMLEMLKAFGVLLVKVRFCTCDVLPNSVVGKVMLVGLSCSAPGTVVGPSDSLVPANPTLNKPPFTWSVALAASIACGANVTWIVQEAPTTRTAGHPFVSAKSTESAPVIETLETEKLVVVLFVSVTLCAGEVLPVSVMGKLTLVGFRSTDPEIADGVSAIAKLNGASDNCG